VTTTFVLDSSAVMAVMFGETGQEEVVATLPGALLSTVNLSETIAKLVVRGVTAQDAENAIKRLGVACVDFSAVHARIAGDLLPLTKPAGLSLGDRACLALGIESRAEILTADRVWAKIDLPVTVTLIR
jgi:PIN domain nuclease of toxin-antitoxin system